MGKQALAPGWQKEDAVDHADYLDPLMDPEDPFHEKAVEAAQLGRAAPKEMAKGVEILIAGRGILVFTGAGISTGSGILDFRGPDGLCKRVDPGDFSLGALTENPAARRRYWTAMRNERLVAASFQPNRAHQAIVDLWKAGRLAGCVTQNVDGLHQAAELPEEMVVELHGTIATVTCLDCADVESLTAMFERLDTGDPDPVCEACGGVLKPTVMFGRCSSPNR